MKKIHIAIDGREANIPNRVGSNVYAFEIITQIEELLQKSENIYVTVLLSNKKIDELPEERSGWHYEVFGPQQFWTQWALPLHLFTNKNKYDILFTPGHYAPRLSQVPYISSVMDTAYLEFPEQFKKSDTLKLTKWTSYSVKNAQKVIAISKYTREKVIEFYGKNPEDVIVAYPAAITQRIITTQKDKQKLFRKHNISEPYFLFVGTIQPRKNIENLVEAFEIFNRMDAGRALQKKYKSIIRDRNNKKVKLVLAGKIGWLTGPIMKRIEKSSLRKKIIITGFISEKEKQILYRNASASCLLGLFEGFGIPPLESLHFGTVPIVSNTTSLPEVVGEAGLLADPLNTQEIADQMWQALHLTTIQKKNFRQKAKQQIRNFNWKHSAEIILNTILQTVEELDGKK